jgi:hypothetical protein
MSHSIHYTKIQHKSAFDIPWPCFRTGSATSPPLDSSLEDVKARYYQEVNHFGIIWSIKWCHGQYLDDERKVRLCDVAPMCVCFGRLDCLRSVLNMSCKHLFCIINSTKSSHAVLNMPLSSPRATQRTYLSPRISSEFPSLLIEWPLLQPRLPSLPAKCSDFMADVNVETPGNDLSPKLRSVSLSGVCLQPNFLPLHSHQFPVGTCFFKHMFFSWKCSSLSS